MTILEYKQHIAAGLPVEAGSPTHRKARQGAAEVIYGAGKTPEQIVGIAETMRAAGQEAILITMEINNRYHTPEELRALLSELWGIEVPESVGMFPPFNTDCGKNTEVGERTFINSGCKFQDQGGIRIGCDCLIGHNATLCTINHNLDPDHRGDMTFYHRILQKAKELLSNSPLGESEGAPLTVTQISQRLGFEYPQHFVRFFKALTGKTPTQWRAA